MLQDVDRRPVYVDLEIRVLGAPTLLVRGRAQPFPPGRPGRLLASLLLARGRVVGVDRLVDDVWGQDLPADARASLHTAVARSRRALGPAGDRLVRQTAGYRFDLTGARVDADVLMDRIASARARGAVQAYDAALSWWAGEPWSTWADDLAQGEALRLREAHVTAREERAALLLRDGRVAEAVGELRLLVAEHPLRDRPVGLLMEALHRQGAAADALAAFSRHRDVLAEELGLDPAPELVDLQRRVLLREPPASAAPRDAPRARSGVVGAATVVTVPPPVGDGPRAPSVLYGRDGDLADLGRLLRLHRVVTVVGPGGVGKTTLARRATADVAAVWWVDLATVSTEPGVRAVTATALDVEVFPGGTPEAALRRRLATAEGLLVLDNCEHVVGAVADLVAEVVEGGDDLTVLATSRERLGLDEEHVYWLSPLGLPRKDELDPDAPSVALFLDRARAAAPDLVVDDTTTAAVTALVRALDGLPLAIELAASRVGVVSLATLQRRLDEHLHILRSHRRRRVPPRHQTLTATIAWSYDLLGDQERRAFRWLSTFAGAFSLDDAEAVLGPGSTEAVLALVERSLLVRPGGERDEYRMLETLRSYARERLDDEESGRASAAHADWAASVAAVAREGLHTSDEARWHDLVERRLPDMARAVRWSTAEGELTAAASIVGDLLEWAYYRVRLDVLAWARVIADHPSGRGERADVLAAASSHAWMVGEHELAAAYGARGVEAGGGADRPESLPALSASADTALAVGDLDGAYDLCRQAHATAVAHGVRTQQLIASSGLVLTRVFQGLPCPDELRMLRAALARVDSPTMLALGTYSEAEALSDSDPVQALELFSRARALAEAVNGRLGVGVSLAAGTALRGRVGALDADTVEQTVRAIEHWLGSGNENLFVTCLRNVVSLLDRCGAHRAAVTLVAATRAHTPHRPPYGAEKERLDTALDRARAALPPAELDAAWAEGLACSLEEAARRTVAVLRALG